MFPHANGTRPCRSRCLERAVGRSEDREGTLTVERVDQIGLGGGGIGFIGRSAREMRAIRRRVGSEQSVWNTQQRSTGRWAWICPPASVCTAATHGAAARGSCWRSLRSGVAAALWSPEVRPATDRPCSGCPQMQTWSSWTAIGRPLLSALGVQPSQVRRPRS